MCTILSTNHIQKLKVFWLGHPRFPHFYESTLSSRFVSVITSLVPEWSIPASIVRVLINNPWILNILRYWKLRKIRIFDSLGNADRHHYETFKDEGDTGMPLHLDNAKRYVFCDESLELYRAFTDLFIL